MEQEIQQLPDQLEESKPVPVEQQISNALVKHNVTEAKISELREKYLPLKINGIEDKENYIIVKEARKDCKGWRVLAEKLCKKGREDAVAIQKAWVSKEKDITGRISEVEDYLEKQEREYEAAVEKEKAERKRKQEEQLITRQQILNNMSVLYSDGKFFLGEVEFEMSVVKECDDEIWRDSILPKFREEYQKIEAERLEQERIKQEREAELRRQQEELERKQRELETKEAELKAAQEEQERKRREEEERKMAEANAAKKAKEKSRMDQLSALGLHVSMEDGHMYFKRYDCYVSYLDITGYDDLKWAQTIEELGNHIIKKKEEEEQKRLSEIEAQKERERIDALRSSRRAMLKQYGHIYEGDLDLGRHTNEHWEELLSKVKTVYEKEQKEKWEKEQEEKRKAVELKKQQEMEQAKDKEKWIDMMDQVNKITVHDMRSSQYRTKAVRFRELLEQIKSL